MTKHEPQTKLSAPDHEIKEKAVRVIVSKPVKLRYAVKSKTRLIEVIDGMIIPDMDIQTQ